MSYEEFQRQLSENWLDPKEASVYVMLAKSGTLKASELARLCDIRRMDAYRILRRLETRGIVEAVMGRPMKFQAVPPEKAFDTLLKSESERVAAMRTEKNHLISLWPTQPLFEEELKDAEKLQIIQGRAEFYSALRRTIKSAHKEILIITTRNGLSRLFYTGFDKDLEAKAEKGISIRILCRVSEGETEAVDRFASIAHLRYLNSTLNTQIMVSDGLQAIVSTSLEDSMSLSSDKDTSIWTNSRDQIAILESLFEELWRGSLDLKTANRLIETGGATAGFQRLIGHAAVTEVTKEALKTAQQSITMLTRSITASPLFQNDYTDLMAEAHQRGVQVRVMTALRDEDAATVRYLGERFDVRVTDIEPDLDLLLIDKRVVVGATLNRDSLQVQREALFVSEPAYASLLDQFLAIVWSRADSSTTALRSIEWVEHTAVVLRRAAETLGAKGLSVETPGIVKGSSSLEYTFPLVARRKGVPESVVIERCTDSQKIISLYAKVVDCDVHQTILLTPPDFQEEALNLASFFGMKVLPLSSAEDGRGKISDIVLAAFA